MTGSTKRGVSELKLSKAQSPNISLKESSAEDSQISSNDETSLNNNIMPNSWGELQVLSNSNFKHCSTKYNIFTIPKHLNSRMY